MGVWVRAEFRMVRFVVRGDGGKGGSLRWFWREICWTCDSQIEISFEFRICWDCRVLRMVLERD